MGNRYPTSAIAWALVCAGLVSGCVIPVRPELGAFEQRLDVYLKTESADKAFLTLDANAASAGDFAAAGTTTGLVSGVARVAGADLASVAISTQAPLPVRYYLNLSKPVTGTLFWTSSSASAGADHVVLRLELYQETTRVGGQEFLFEVVAEPTDWLPFNFLFRPEVRFLEAGIPLALKVTRQGGYGDLVIGATGTHASTIEFRYFDADPLSTAIYVRDNHIVTSLEGAEAETTFSQQGEAKTEERSSGAPTLSPLRRAPEPGNGPGLAPLALSVAGLASAPWTGRTRRREMAAILLASALVAAGCLGSKSGGAGDASLPSTGNVDSFLENRTDLGNAGALEGRVADENGFAVTRASVSLVGTIHFTYTDVRGEFAFPNLTAGPYDVRFDAVGFESIERTVEVVAGNILHVNVTLPRDPSRTPHGHDYWGGATQKVVEPVTFLPRSPNLVSFLFFDSATMLAPAQTWYCPGARACQSDVPLDPSFRVLPGTVEVEVRLSWSSLSDPNELQLGIKNAGNDTEYFFYPRGPDDPYRIVIFPDEADSGHQNFTNWEFKVRPPYLAAPVADGGAPAYSGGPVTVSITLHKGVVPYERTHRKFWNGATELPIFSNALLSSGCPNCPYPDSSRFAWTPANQVFVPPGTATIKGTFKWKNWQDNALITWALTYQGADAPPGANVYHPIPLRPVGPGEASFEFTPPADTLDKFYQSESLWRFAPDDQQDPIIIYNGDVTAVYVQEWWLTAVAYRAADYVEATLDPA